MSVPYNISHDTRVCVWYNGRWWGGKVIENLLDNDRLIVVRTDQRVSHKGSFLDGYGLSVGYESTDIEIEIPNTPRQ